MEKDKELGNTYVLHDPHRGDIAVKPSLFSPNSAEYMRRVQEVGRNPDYINCVELGKTLALKRKELQREVREIQRENFSDEMKLLRRARADSRAAKEVIVACHDKMDRDIPPLERRAAELADKIDRLPDDSADRVSLVSERDKALHDIQLCHRRNSEKISRAAKRQAKCETTISQLVVLKEHMIQDRLSEIEELGVRLCALKEKRISIIRKTFGPLLDNAMSVLALVKKDPHLSEETVRKIFELQPDYVHAAWHFDGPFMSGSMGLINSCICEDKHQSMADLVVRVAHCRNCQFVDALRVLDQLRKKNELLFTSRCPDGSIKVFRWRET